MTSALDVGRRDLSASLIALRVTAVLLLLRPVGPWFVQPAILMGAGTALIVPAVLRSPALWFGQAVLLAAAIGFDWPLDDNHIYLLAYWCLAIGLALGAAQPSIDLALSSRWLLGCAFACAVLWKVFSPDYLDERFFRVTLLVDPRFDSVARLVGPMSPADMDAARQVLMPLPEGAELVETPANPDPSTLGRLAWALTWGGLTLELLVAGSMLAPGAGRVALVRHASLLVFCVMTYALAPVAGFGWLLVAMGLAQCGPSETRLRAAYVAAFCLVLLYDGIPWVDLIANRLVSD
jgi:hypothetical protein